MCTYRRLCSSLALVFVASVSACGHPETPPPSTVPAADRARALKITDVKDLIGGPKASGRVGDLLIANTRVRFVVEPAGRTRSWFPVGGAIIDADRVRPAGQPDDDRLQEMVTRLGSMSVLFADTVVIANDGADGNAAVIRVTGHDMGVPILQSVARTPPSNVHAVTEYRLDPYADSLEIKTTVSDATGADHAVQAGDVFVLGDFVSLFAPVVGTDRNQLQFAQDLRFFAAFGGTASYGYNATGHKLSLFVPQAEIFAVGTERVAVPANGSVTTTRFFTVGGGDVAGLLPEIVRREGGAARSLVTLTGGVTEQHTPAAVPGATLLFADGKGPYALAVADEKGRYSAPLERLDYTVTVGAPDRASVGPNPVHLAGSDVPAPLDFKLADTGRFTVAVIDALGAPSPARLQIHGKDGSGWGNYLSPDGKGDGVLPPGEYVAVVSRGYEWEAASVPFTVTAGATVKIAATLSRVVDTSGFIAIDSHTHTAMSVDSQLDPRERVAQALADGVELVITTEHDVLYDLAPLARDMGVTGHLATAIGCEVSPVPGHINAFPSTLGASADTDGYWAVKWWSEDMDHMFIQDLWPKDIFAAIRSKLSPEIVQLNHPRSTQGVLNWVGYDAARGLSAVDATRFDMNWDAIEVCNAGCNGDPSSEDGKALRDFYSFLNQGYRRTAVGVSDAHVSTHILGRARTLVEVRDDDPAHLDLGEVWASLKAGRAVVEDGPFVTASILDDQMKPVTMGGLAAATGAKLTIHVKVQAPSWIPTETIQLIENGMPKMGVTIPDAGTPPKVVRFDGDMVIDAPRADAWYMVIVTATTPMAPVIAAAPRALTNPIYVDRNNNGKFDAPNP